MWKYWMGSAGNDDRPIEEKATALLHDLKDQAKGKRIIKVTFFLSCVDKKYFESWLDRFRQLAKQELKDEVMVAVIPQTPVDVSLSIEAWLIEEDGSSQITLQQAEGRQTLQIAGDHNMLLVYTYALSGEVQRDASFCFDRVDESIQASDFSLPQLFRQWNYIGDILQVKNGRQNYQVFNEVRAQYFANTAFDHGYPAATGIGMDFPGVVVEACFVNSKKLTPVGIANPIQVSAHSYSDKVLISQLPEKSTPKFERAKALVNHKSSTIYISGTAAILGEDTYTSTITEEQTYQTLHVIDRLVESENIRHYVSIDNASNAQYTFARVYLKHGYISDEIRKMVSRFFNLPNVTFLSADICRDDLLVEIEAEYKIN